MPRAPLPFVSLPEVVLREILADLLVDTPRSPTRAAVLRTCSTFHQLGSPLLYRVVDLLQLGNSSRVVACWDTLFGERGTLTDDTGSAHLKRCVFELRIGGPVAYEDMDPLVAFHFRPTHLQSCNSLSYDTYNLPLSRSNGSRERMLVELPITSFTFSHGSALSSQGAVCFRNLNQSLSTCILKHERPWKDLRTVQIVPLWHDRRPLDETGPPRLAFSGWSFETLVVKFTNDWFPPQGRDAFLGVLLNPVDSEESNSWWRGMTRIQMTLPEWLEAALKERANEARKAGRLARLQRRILPMVVFVDKDGTERKLIEDEEHTP